MKSYKYLLIAAVVAIPVLGSSAYLCATELEERRMEELLAQTPAQIVARMSLEDRVGQLIHIGMRGKEARGAVLQEISAFRPGGVILFAVNLGDAEQIRQLNAGLQTHAIRTNGIPLLISTDQESGRVLRIGPDGVDQFPSAMALGQSGDPELAREVGFVTGYRLRKLGVNFALAPVLDVNNNPANPVINTRSFGSRPETVASIGGALARGLRESLSIPVIKHFPGHGDTSVDSHYDLPVIHKSLEEMHTMELAPFRAAIGEGAEVVMSAHIVFESLDRQNPATLSPRILKKLLREELGFQGMVMTDAMEMNAISKRYPRGEAAKAAFKAGVDVVLLTSDGAIIREMYRSLLAGFRSGELSEADLNRSVERQIALKLQRGLFHLHKSDRVANSAELAEYLQRREQAADARFAAIEKKYAEQGVSLNRAASRAGVRALRRDFAGLAAGDLGRVHFIYRTPEAREQALELGLPEARLHRAASAPDIYMMLRLRKANEIWLVELDDLWTGAWNRLERILARTPEARLKGPTIALHPGNPFLMLHTPAQGAVLCAFSPTEEARRALVYRALRGGPAPAADLVLPPEP